MDWNGPLHAELGGRKTRFQKAIHYLGHYDCRVYLAPKAYIDLGAGSLQAVMKVVLYGRTYEGSLGKIGRWCDTADCGIMADGDHRNDQPINIAFSTAPVFKQLAAMSGVSSLVGVRPISIGNGVLLSSHAVVLPGVAVGDGAVLGAGAIVTREVPPFAIMGGSPAKLIRKRFSEDEIATLQSVAWWNFAPAYMAQKMPILNQLATDAGPHPYRVDRPKFVLQIGDSNDGVAVLGYEDNGQTRTLSDAPEKVRKYVEQAFGDSGHYWLADVWDAAV